MDYKRFIYFFVLTTSLIINGVSDDAILRYNLVKDLPDVYLTPFSEKIGHTWQNGQVWDKQLIHKFYSIITKHNEPFVVFDIGAQTGSFSLLAKFLPNSSWYAFEPLKEAAETLKTNLELNNVQNVFVFQAAVSDFSGHAQLKMPPMNAWGLSTIGPNCLRFTPIEERSVDCIDLDSFVLARHISKIDFMKLDTEGSELAILMGALKVIARDRPVILMEYNETNMKQCGVVKDQVDAFLNAINYDWEQVSGDDILCIPRE